MYCKKCGSQVTENDQFCKNCGSAVEGGVQPQVQSQAQQNFASYNQNNYPKKSNNGIIIGVIIVVALLFIGSIYGGSNSSTESSGSDLATQKIYYNGYDFDIPKKYDYQKGSDGISIVSESDGWEVMIGIDQGSFSILSGKKEQLKSIFQSRGYTVNSVTEKNLNNLDYIVAEVSKSGTNGLIGYAQIDSNSVAVLGAYSTSNTFDLDPLRAVAPVIRSARVSTGSSNISNENFKISNFDVFGEVMESSSESQNVENHETTIENTESQETIEATASTN